MMYLRVQSILKRRGFFMQPTTGRHDLGSAPSREPERANQAGAASLFCPDLSYSRQPYCEEDNMKRTLFAAGIIRGGVARWYPRRTR